MEIFDPKIKDPQDAFDFAIMMGRLSKQRNQWNYAGNYMYMYTTNGKDQFKNSLTRKYLD